MDHETGEQGEILVTGAGLGGLACALLLARGGARVRVLDAAEHAGGRARSRVQDGFVLNVGPHALTRRGPAERVLRELGVKWSGKPVGRQGGFALYKDRLAPLPTTPWALLGSDLLSGSGKLAFMRVLAGLGERKALALRGQSVEQWLAAAAPNPDTHALLSMFVRLACYAHAPQLLGAEAAVRQVARLARHGVDYLDGGWQSLLDALLAQLRERGVVLELGAGVREIETQAERVSGLLLRDGRRLPAQHVVAAVDPQTLAALLPGDAIAARWARAAVPLRAACLDLGVRGPLPHPERLSAQSLDAPLYFSNHSAYARLAPEGSHLLSLVRYLGPGEDGRSTEPELRAFLERVQPGVWERAAVKRFMPNLTVHNDLPNPERARAEHPELAGLHLCSDVSSPRAMLADAVLDSADAAARRILEAQMNRDRAA